MLRCSDDSAPAIKRLEAAMWTELALGESRAETALRLVAIATVLASGVGEGQPFARDVVGQLRDLADRVEAKAAAS